jgi:hypothetical protein
MCQRVTCTSCGKPTYVGCGRHIESVLGDVAPDARCSCREAKAMSSTGPVPTPPTLGKRGWLSMLLGRSSSGRA